MPTVRPRRAKCPQCLVKPSGRPCLQQRGQGAELPPTAAERDCQVGHAVCVPDTGPRAKERGWCWTRLSEGGIWGGPGGQRASGVSAHPSQAGLAALRQEPLLGQEALLGTAPESSQHPTLHVPKQEATPLDSDGFLGQSSCSSVILGHLRSLPRFAQL